MIGVYLRVSTDEQAKGQTIDVQRADFKQYAERNKVQIKFYEDDGVSGEIPLEHRKGGAELLRDLAAGKLKRVMVWRADRLGRELFVIVSALKQIEQYAPCESLYEGVLSLKDPTKILTTAIHSGMASQEKALTRFRTMNGSQKWARDGVWLGGIVPYGYRKVGDRKTARIEPATEPIPGFEEWTEVKVIERIYQMASEGKSCVTIADWLNQLGIPPSYFRAGREVLRGKRKQRTSGRWQPSRIRNMLVNPTYMGIHEYGKRRNVHDEKHGRHLKVNPPDQWIKRPCTPLVTEDVWKRANVALHRNQIAAMAHPKHSYLLRGMIRCGHCGLTYVANAATRPSGKREFYYRCSALYRRYRGVGKCPSPSIRGDDLEKAVWGHVAAFLARPGAAIRQLQRKMRAETSDHRVAEEIKDLESSLGRQDEARQRILRQVGAGLFREDEIKRALQRLDAEAKAIDERLAELRKVFTEHATRILNLDWAGRLLGDLREKIMDGELTFEKKRQFVETLVAGITVHPTADPKRPEIRVKYYFGPDHERFKEWRDDPGSGGGISLAPDNTPARADFTATPRMSAAAPAPSFSVIWASSAARCWTVSICTSRCPLSLTRSCAARMAVFPPPRCAIAFAPRGRFSKLAATITPTFHRAICGGCASSMPPASARSKWRCGAWASARAPTTGSSKSPAPSPTSTVLNVSPPSIWPRRCSIAASIGIIGHESL